MNECRLIVEGVPATETFQYSGVANMAIDETLLRTAADTGAATLRFYGWKPATLSLGYFQKISDRVGHAASLGCEVVRRTSGGGAILHDRELTYCFATPAKTRFGDPQDFYLAFHETLVEVFRDLGVYFDLYPLDASRRDEAFLCFQRRSQGDVVLGEYKVAGSAQRRWRNALLQHGSLLLAQSAYAPELPGLQELASLLNVDNSTLIRLWQRKLALRLKTEFVPEGLADKELELARRLAEDKFSRGSWTNRR